MNSFLSNNKIMALIMSVSILLQILFIVNYKANPVESDAIQYNLLAKNLLHNKIFSLDGKTINITRSPGYPLFIWLVYLLSGEIIWNVQLAQVFLIALTCVLAYKIGCVIFDKKAGILAALLSALNPILICQSFPLLSEALMTFLMTASIYLAVISHRTCRIKYFILLGVFLGVAALTKPIVLLLPFFSISMLMVFYNWKKILRFSLFFLIPFISIVGIWIYYDYSYTGYFIPLQIMGGRSLWTGTYVQGEGFDEHPLTIKARDELSDRLSVEIKKRNGKDIEEKSSNFDILTLLVMRQFGQEGIKNIMNDPIGFIKILPYKFGRLYIGSYSYLYGVKEKYEELLNDKKHIKNAKIKLNVKLFVLLVSVVISIFSLIGICTSILGNRTILPVIILFLYWNTLFVFLDTMTRYSIPLTPILTVMAAKGFYSIKYMFYPGEKP